MLKATLICLLAIVPMVVLAWDDSDELTRADVRFFFDSARFENGEWIYKLSSNTHGMLWRIRDKKSDVTGKCESGSVLRVLQNASLEIKNKEVDLLIYWPYGAGKMHEARLTIKSTRSLSAPSETRTSLIASGPGGDMALKHVRE